MTDDPIADNPDLLWTWTRIVIALVGILAFVVGYGEVEIPSSAEGF